MKKTIALILILCMTLPLFSCGSGSNAVSGPFSVTRGLFGKSENDEMMEYEGFGISKGLIRYTFARMRSIAYETYTNLDQYLNTYGVYYGYQGLGVTVDDSDTFWNSVYVYAGTEGQTFAENAKENAVTFLKNALIIEKLVNEYDYPGLDADSEEKIAEYRQEMIDLYGSEAMFRIELASYPITMEQWEWWERSMLRITEFKNFLYGKEGPLELSPDEFTLIGVKPVEFNYMDYEPTEPTEPSSTTAESTTAASEPETSSTAAEASAAAIEPEGTAIETATGATDQAPSAAEPETVTTGSETTDTVTASAASSEETTTTTEAKTEQTYSEEAKSKAMEAAIALKAKIVSGEISVDDAYASSYFAMYYPDGVSISKEEMKNTFGIDPDSVKTGDVAIAESSGGLFLFCICDLSESDYSQQLSTLSNQKFGDLVESLSEKIVYKNDGKAYIDSLKITDFVPAAKAKTTTETET